MRFFLLYLVYGIAAVALQTTWFCDWPSHLVRLHLVLMAVVSLTFTEEWKRALPLLVVLGLLEDGVSMAPFGSSIMSFVIMYVIMRTIISKISFQPGLGRFVWISFLSFGEQCLFSLLLVIRTGDLVWFQVFLMRGFPQVLFDGVCGLLFMPALVWFTHLSWEKFSKPKGLVV